MFGRHITKGFSWVLVIALLLTSVTVAAAQPGDGNPGKPPAPPEEPISQTPDVDPLLLDGDASEPASAAAPDAVPLWNIAGNFTVRDNLGVGTENPTSKIHTVRNYNGTTSIRVENTYGGNAALASLNLSTASNRGVQLQKFGNAYSGTWNGLSMANWARLRADSATAGMMVGTGGLYPLLFGTGDIERARITPAGNLEVGTRTDDTHRVTVRNTGSDNVLRVIGPDGGGLGYGARLNFGDSDYVYLDEDLDDKLTIYASGRTALMGGRVGVGTLNPTSGQLHVVTSDSTAVYASAGNTATSKGVVGITSGSDFLQTAGVWGEKSTGDGTGVRGHKAGGYGVAVRGINVGTSGSGTLGSSTNYTGIWGETGRTDNNYGLYSPDNLYSLNIHSMGAMMQIVQNVGQEPLEPGDLVAFAGISGPLEAGGPPVIQVVKIDSANSTAVSGVVSSRFNIEVVTAATADGPKTESAWEVTPPGAAAPGEYLLMVTHGPAQVKANATNNAIQAGDLLAAGTVAGSASKAAEVTINGVGIAVPGTVFGKALQAMPSGDGLLYVFVTLQ